MADLYKPPHKFEGATRWFKGGVYDDQGRTLREWENAPCFAVWPEAHGQDVKTIIWEHGLRHLRFGKTYTPIMRNGWNNVIQKIFQKLPDFDTLRKSGSISADVTQVPLWEVSIHWRVVRALHEHPQMVIGCHWLYQKYGHRYPPEVLLAMSCGQVINSAGRTGESPRTLCHFSLYTGDDWQHTIQLAYALHVTRRQGGRMLAGPWQPKWDPKRMVYSGLLTAIGGDYPSAGRGYHFPHNYPEIKLCGRLRDKLVDRKVGGLSSRPLATDLAILNRLCKLWASHPLSAEPFLLKFEDLGLTNAQTKRWNEAFINERRW